MNRRNDFRFPALALLLAAPCAVLHAQTVDHAAVRCEAMPKEEMRPQMELQRKLSGEGWKVRQIKNFNGCYEVYGFDAAGRRVEVFFNPKTFEKVGEVAQPS
ncbi:PepSY domain-containing protein [Pseudacidovorax sp. RU35E]|uniref:PepSY domain-containing protein n=1 Tax=Pseudacidovorax sp. RU35E TaxID=1907403 RepID=UPI0009543EBA|nr:PepSY domain-containing protein [Pseudacidovorax sp. RU35E]SIP92631.1 Peptidase propeptide and YPEB domain-containing protein [Pseudacidovorax sp. RU35E]